jgi:hypothetical protein
MSELAGWLVESLVRRHMKLTSEGSFTRYPSDKPVPPHGELPADESLLGWYRNPAPWEDSVIMFTTRALIFVNGESHDRVPLEDIVDYELPQSKTDVTGVRIRTQSGFRFVRVAGRFEPPSNVKDAFIFVGFLQAITHRP